MLKTPRLTSKIHTLNTQRTLNNIIVWCFSMYLYCDVTGIGTEMDQNVNFEHSRLIQVQQ